MFVHKVSLAAYLWQALIRVEHICKFKILMCFYTFSIIRLLDQMEAKTKSESLLTKSCGLALMLCCAPPRTITIFLTSPLREEALYLWICECKSLILCCITIWLDIYNDVYNVCYPCMLTFMKFAVEPEYYWFPRPSFIFQMLNKLQTKFN